jgi:arylsulfatase A-like enzyme
MLSVRSICIPLASVALLLACTEASEPARGPNVVLVTIDTLRADSLGAYGARTPRTPHVDRLAREGTLWENATSSIPATKPSHFSLLSSRYPRDHGVLNNEGVLPDDVLSVVEVFQRAGWSTAGFVASSLLDSSSGAARGFDLLDAPRRPTRDADRVVPRATRWLEEVALSEPFFLWIHLFDPHIPYAPPPEHVPAEAASGSNGLARVGWKSLASIAEAHAGDLPREVLERALALYAGEVAHVDHWMGVLLDALERRELLDQTALLFTADHGECFENGIYFFHSNCLYEAAVRVPLILRYPRAVESGLRRPEVVENLDVAPTLLRLAGLEVPAVFDGRDLLAPRPAEAERAFAQHPLYPAGTVRRRSVRQQAVRSVAGEPMRPLVVGVEEVALRTREWKLILTGDEPALYHLPSDPAEKRDRAAEQPELVRELRGQLERWRNEHPLRIEDEGAINPELLEALRELGYAQ